MIKIEDIMENIKIRFPSLLQIFYSYLKKKINSTIVNGFLV